VTYECNQLCGSYSSSIEFITTDKHGVLAVVSEVQGSQPGEDKALIVLDAADGNLPVGMIETEKLSCARLRKEYQKANLESNPDSNLIHALHDLAEYESQLRLASVVSCIHKHSPSNTYLDVQITPAESDVLLGHIKYYKVDGTTKNVYSCTPVMHCSSQSFLEVEGTEWSIVSTVYAQLC